MAHYDTVHAGFRHGRTTALGSTFATIVTGDEVRLYPAPAPGANGEGAAGSPERRAAADRRRSTPPGEPGPQRDFQLAMPSGGFLIVRGGVLRAWTDEPQPALPCVGPAGEQRHPGAAAEPPDPTARKARAPRPPRYLEMPELPAACAVCAAVRAGRVPDYRATVAAELAEQRAAGRDRRREQRRVGKERRAAAGRPLRAVPDSDPGSDA